jgi:hypothetical protein
MPNYKERFPYGFGGFEDWFSRQDLAKFLGSNLTLLLGEEDTGASLNPKP